MHLLLHQFQSWKLTQGQELQRGEQMNFCGYFDKFQLIDYAF